MIALEVRRARSTEEFVIPDFQPSDPPRVLRADPARRRLYAVLGFLLVVLLYFGVLRFQDFLDGIVAGSREDPEAAVETLRQAARGVFGAMALGALALAAVVARLSVLALRHGEFPPPGTRVVRDTPILEGSAARRRAFFGVALAIGLAVLGILVPWQAHEVFEQYLFVVLERAAERSASPL